MFRWIGGSILALLAVGGRFLLTRNIRARMLQFMVIILGFRVVAWDEDNHQRKDEPHDIIHVTKIALRD